MSLECPVEAPLMRAIMDKATRAGIPANGTFELTPLCNYACKMCYVRKTAEEVKKSDRPMMQLKDWLKLAEECKKSGTLSILLTGGEPLIWPDFWNLYNALHQMGFLVSVNTNGSLIDASVIEKWKEKPPIRVNVTLYGASDETYEKLCGTKKQFSRVYENIKALKAAGITTKINCSLTPLNVEDMERILQIGEEEALIVSMTPYMFPPLRREEASVGQNQRFTPQEAGKQHLRRSEYQMDAERYRKYLKAICESTVTPYGLAKEMDDTAEGTVKCRAGRGSFWITWDGWMTPCGMMPIPKTDLLESDFSKAWQETKEKTARLRLSTACKNCPDHALCNACAAMAYTETGSTEKIPKYLCEMVEAMREIAKQECE